MSEVSTMKEALWEELFFVKKCELFFIVDPPCTTTCAGYWQKLWLYYHYDLLTLELNVVFSLL